MMRPSGPLSDTSITGLLEAYPYRIQEDTYLKAISREWVSYPLQGVGCCEVYDGTSMRTKSVTSVLDRAVVQPRRLGTATPLARRARSLVYLLCGVLFLTIAPRIGHCTGISVRLT